MSNSKFVDLGAIMERKDGGYYIKLSKDVTININGKTYNNEYINVNDPKDKLDRFLEKGFLTESEYEERLEKIPEYIKFELTAQFK